MRMITHVILHFFFFFFFFFNDTATTEIYTLSLHDALPISDRGGAAAGSPPSCRPYPRPVPVVAAWWVPPVDLLYPLGYPSTGGRVGTEVPIGRALCQRQEQLLHPLQVQGLVRALLGGGHALLQPTRDDFEPGPVQRPGHRRELGDHVGTVPALFEHPDDAPDLPLRAAQPLDHFGGRRLLDPHRRLPSANPGVRIPAGVLRDAPPSRGPARPA